MSYSQKTIQNLKPDWYVKLSTKDKLKEQERLISERKTYWDNKPQLLPSGTQIICHTPTGSLTNNKVYVIQGHFCSLVTTIYGSVWHQFVTIKNDYGYTVKVNLNKFEKLRTPA